VRARRAFATDRHLLIVFLLLATVVASYAQPTQAGDLRTGFAHPPDAAKLRCYWWWLNGNTTAETITRDLEAMKSKGFGGAILVDGDGSGEQGNREVAPGPVIGTPQWTGLMVHALAVAQRLGLELSLNVTSRWDVGIIGGQTVTPEDAIKMLTWTRTPVDGGGVRTVSLPAPSAENGFYRPIAVLAYPLHHGAPLPGARGSQRTALLDLNFKTASMETGFSTPRAEEVLRNAPSTAGEQDAALAEVIDLSAHVDQNGALHWDFPAGSWEVLRIGYSDTDKKLRDATGAVRGLPLDVMSAAAFDHYWQQAVTPLLHAAQPYIGTSLKYLVTDSWEAGGVNWTDDFRAQFQRRRGYDPLSYLPIVAGRILSSRETSDRFLYDLRRTIADLITENYYDRFAAHAQAAGLGTHPESGGPHGAPIDALETFRGASFMQSEFWADSGWHRTAEHERYFVKEAASAAHIYGKNEVAAEGPTSMHRSAWSEALATNVQPAIDHAFTEGLNRIFWHEFTSSPASFGKPGQEYFAGTHLNPNVTWWEQSAPFLLSLNRAQFLLQQGEPVSDLLYDYGEQVPNFVRPKSEDPAHLLPGYDYDVVNQDALLHRMRMDGPRLTTPEGLVYRALALPASRLLSYDALQWVEHFVAQGGVVIGLAPKAPLGLLPGEQTQTYHRTVAALWSGCEHGVAEAHYGKGRVECTDHAREAFARIGVAPDFAYTLDKAEEATAPSFDFVHRRTATAEIYFVRNTQATASKATLSFRVTERVPALWSPEDGSISPAAVYRATADGRTEIPLTFPAHGSVFVVFEHAPEKHLVRAERNGVEVFPSIHPGEEAYASDGEFVAAAPGSYRVIDSEGAEHRFAVQTERINTEKSTEQNSRWTLSFPGGWGAPPSVPVAHFQSWTEWTEPGVRYFSGTATYRTTLQLTDALVAPGQQLWLELGAVREIATVLVNGKPAGTTWRAPYAVRLDGLVHAGENRIEVQVSNLWPNRLIGDQQPETVHPFTQTNVQAYTKDSPLLPSGILAPVIVQSAQILRWRTPAGGQ
jgi:hypothetical protein